MKRTFKVRLNMARVLIGFVVLLVILVLWHVVAGHYTPYAHTGYCQTMVLEAAPRIEGRVVAVHVRGGRRVRQGDPLFDLDPQPHRLAVEQLEAALVHARALILQLEQRRKALDAEIAEAGADMAYYKLVYDELSQLKPEEASSTLQVAKAKRELESAMARHDAARFHVGEVQAVLDAKIHNEYATILEAQRELDLARWKLGQCRVTAPLDGVVSNLQLRVGAFIKAGDPAMTVVDDYAWRIVAEMPENALARIKPGQAVNYSVNMYPGRVFHGTVDHVDAGVADGQGRPSGQLPRIKEPDHWLTVPTRFPVRIVPQPMPAGQPLRVGGSVRVTIYTVDGPLAWLAWIWQCLVSWWDLIY